MVCLPVKDQPIIATNFAGRQGERSENGARRATKDAISANRFRSGPKREEEWFPRRSAVCNYFQQVAGPGQSGLPCLWFYLGLDAMKRGLSQRLVFCFVCFIWGMAGSMATSADAAMGEG